MHLTDQPAAWAGDQPEARAGPEALAGMPPVGARVSKWLRAARHAVGRIFNPQAAIDKSAAQDPRETLEQVITDLEVSRARGMLQEIGERNPSPLPLDGSPAPDNGCNDFATNYTMQSELDVQGLTLTAPAEQPDCPTTEAGELGENVEFL